MMLQKEQGLTSSAFSMDLPTKLCKSRQAATVCLLSSALALASIQDANNQNGEDDDGAIL
jgi:hypothetical protein